MAPALNFDILELFTFMKRTILLNCLFCQEWFLANKYEVEKRNARFCSKECINNSNREKLNCKNCGKEFSRQLNYRRWNNEYKNSFCTRSCSTTFANNHKTHGPNRSKLEIWLETNLIKCYPNLKFNFNDRTAINSELDIYIPSLNLAFELNGIFHYEPIFGEKKLNKTINNDNRKFQACLENKIELCIIDTSKQKYFKESTSIVYFDIIKTIINLKL